MVAVVWVCRRLCWWEVVMVRVTLGTLGDEETEKGAGPLYFSISRPPNRGRLLVQAANTSGPEMRRSNLERGSALCGMQQRRADLPSPQPKDPKKIQCVMGLPVLCDTFPR
jgi:hypothetical protein